MDGVAPQIVWTYVALPPADVQGVAAREGVHGQAPGAYTRPLFGST